MTTETLARRGTALEMGRVTKTYDGTPPVHALIDVDLSIRDGELIGIVGPSGSGKSTLLHIMGTLDRATSGLVKVAGLDVAKQSDKQLSAIRSRHIGFVFQQFFLLAGESALDNVADGLLYTGMPVSDRRDLAIDSLDRVGLRNRATHMATKLSGGERQRVAIARAVIGSPRIVLADEPTGNLDSRTGLSIIELLEDLNAEGATIVVITHDRDLAVRLPRQVAILDGRIAHDENIRS
jgi:putative ABC transport system ATP-binding protein